MCSLKIPGGREWGVNTYTHTVRSNDFMEAVDSVDVIYPLSVTPLCDNLCDKCETRGENVTIDSHLSLGRAGNSAECAP